MYAAFCCIEKDGAMENDGAMERWSDGRAPEVVFSLQRKPQIASALLQCDPIVTEASIDLS